MKAMQLEASVRVDPAQRAVRFVEDWRQLKAARDELRQGGDTQAANRIAGRMAEMAKGLERDPQVELQLRGKARELGIELGAGKSLTQELGASVALQRSRDIGMGL